MVKKLLPSSDNSLPANPPIDWPGPDAVPGAIPSMPVFARPGPQASPFLAESPQPAVAHCPFVLGLGRSAAAALVFAFNQALQDPARSPRNSRVILFGASASFDLPLGEIWHQHLDPAEESSERAFYRDWFVKHQDQIRVDLEKAIAPGTTEVIVITHLGDAESGALASFLYLLRTYPLLNDKKISLVISPPGNVSDSSPFIPGYSEESDPLSSMREVLRFTWRGYHQQKQLKDNLQRWASECTLVDSLFWIGSPGRSREADVQQMSEYLALLLHKPAHLLLDQVSADPLSTAAGRGQTQAGFSLNEAVCASLYLPVAEHRNYLRALLIKELFFGPKGIFKNSGEADPQSLLVAFRNYPEFSHPLFTWLLDSEPGPLPSLVYFPASADLFARCLLAFVDQQFLNKTSIFAIHAFLLKVCEILRERKNSLERQKDASISSLAGEFENTARLFQVACKDWIDRINLPEDDSIRGNNPFASVARARSRSLKASIDANLATTYGYLVRLAERIYSVPAIDGNIARDQQLIHRVQEKIENHNLPGQFSWRFEETHAGFTLCLFIGAERINLNDLSERFWLCIEEVLKLPISDLLMIDNENFKTAVGQKVSSLALVNTSGLMKKDAQAPNTLRFLFSNAEIICRDSAPVVFGHYSESVHSYANFPTSRLTALVANIGIPLETTPIYNDNIRDYYSRSKDTHLQAGERLAREIENSLPGISPQNGTSPEYRFLSPEVIFSLEEDIRTRLFFEAWLCRLIVGRIDFSEPGQLVWVIKPVGAYGEVKICNAPQGLPDLESLYLAYHALTIDRLPQKMGTETRSPFHTFRWDGYSRSIKDQIDSTWSTKLAASVIAGLMASYKLTYSEKQVKNHPDICFRQFFNELSSPSRHREYDLAALIYYYFQKRKGVKNG